MYLKIMTSLSLVALAVALFLPVNASYQVFLQFLVCASAALITWNAVRDRAQYLWAVVFCGIAIVFNPIVPLALPGRVSFVLTELALRGAFSCLCQGIQGKTAMVHGFSFS